MRKSPFSAMREKRSFSRAKRRKNLVGLLAVTFIVAIVAATTGLASASTRWHSHDKTAKASHSSPKPHKHKHPGKKGRGTGGTTVTTKAPPVTTSPARPPATTTPTTHEPSTTTPTSAPETTTTGPDPTDGSAPALHVAGNHIVTAGGNAVQLRGVNRPGPEYTAVEGDGIFDGPTDDDVSIAAMKSWGINSVRIPLNEDSWLGINNVDAAYNGAPYRSAIVDYVNRLNANGIIAIPNLHFSAPGGTVPDDQSPMADEDHSPAFWSSVASTFKGNSSVILDVFNEPYPDNNNDTTAAWSCVLNGGTCAGVSYETAGMQQLVDVIRATGATQPLMIAGPEYAGDLDRWMQYEPVDPLHQLIASVHIYGLPLDSPYRVSSTWDTYITPVTTQVPVIIGEFGDTNCTSVFSPPLMTWADAHGVGYFAWAWVTSNCAGDPALITNYNGTPTPYGAGVRTHLLAQPKEW